MSNVQAQVGSPGFIKTNTPAATLFWSTFIAGNLDALAGCIVYFLLLGFNPIQVLQFIASGIHGPEAINSGLLMAFAGLIYHFAIAFGAAFAFFLAYPRLPFLAKNTAVWGLAFGVAVWAFMNFLVLPYSNIPKAPFNGTLAFWGILWHAALVGLPIALITKKHFDARA